MFANGTAGPTVGWGGASPTIASSKFSCPAWTPLASFESRPGKSPVKCSQHLVVSPWEPQRKDLGRTVVQGSRLAGRKGGVAPEKNPRKRGGGVGECISVSGRAGSRRRNRCRASWEVSCRSWKSCDGSRRRSRLVCADNWSGYGGTPSGPHPGEGRGV